MYTSLLSYILLTSTNPWVTQNSWNCLENSLGYVLDTVSVSSDVDIKNIPGKTVYWMGTHFLPRHLIFDNLLIHQTLRNWHGRDLRGKVVILTESLNDIDQIWTRFKIAHLLVLLQINDTCEIYTWYPYKPGSCHKPTELIHQSTCVNGKFPKNFSFDEQFANMTGCPLVAALANCPLLVTDGTGGVKIGPEVDILANIARQHGMVLVQAPQDPREYFTHHSPDTEQRNAYDLLRNREIDIAASCLSVSLSKNDFEFLPSHIPEHLTWFFPGPTQDPVTFGAITTLHYKVWIGLIITFILIFTFASCVHHQTSLHHRRLKYHSIGYGISWTTARMFSVPSPPLRNTTLRLISVLFELTMLIISASYKSMLLFNLFIDTQFVFKNAKQASEHGLTALIRPDPLIDLQAFAEDIQSRLFVPERFKFVDEYDYNLLVVNRSVMLLGWQFLEQAIIRTTFPNLTYLEIVTTQEEAHAMVYITFFMPPHHPLEDIMSNSVLNVIQAGLPGKYVQSVLDQLPGRGVVPGYKRRQPLNMHQVLFIFLVLLTLLTISLLVFCIEVNWHRLKM